MNAVVIHAKPQSYEQVDAPIGPGQPGVEWLQSVVGGCFQVVTAQTGLMRKFGITMWLNEDGKIAELDRNILATAMARACGMIEEADYIAGDVVITGPADDDGETTEVPWPVLASLRAVTPHLEAGAIMVIMVEIPE